MNAHEHDTGIEDPDGRNVFEKIDDWCAKNWKPALQWALAAILVVAALALIVYHR